MASPIFKLFGRSPFTQLYHHIHMVCECVGKLSPFFQAAIAGDWEKAKPFCAGITQLEYKADELKRDFRLNLPRDFFMPIARSDLLSLVSDQDTMANRAKEIADLVFGRKMHFPEAIQKLFKKYVDRCVESTRQAEKTIRELNDLFESGFGRKETEIIRDMIERLHHIEHDTHEIQTELRSMLYTLEASWPPVDMVFMYKMITWLGLLADDAQSIGDRLQLCIGK